MSNGFSLYESMNQSRADQRFGITLGRIVSVDSAKRLCKVATMMGPDLLNDNIIEHCQWLVPDGNPEGDELGSIPRRGSMGLVFFVDGEAFIGPFFKPSWNKAQASREGVEEPNLLEGDKIMSTLAGNRIVVKRSGLIEMTSKASLRRLMYPDGSKIVDLCRDYNLKADGGEIRWNADNLTQMVLHRSEYWKDLVRSFMILEERGGVTADIISRTTIGPAVVGLKTIPTPIYVQEISIIGEVTTTITAPTIPASPVGYKQTINGPLGTVETKTGVAHNTTTTYDTDGSFKMEINKGLLTVEFSATGAVKIKGPLGTLNMDEAGVFSFENKLASLEVSEDGSFEFTNNLVSVFFDATGEVSISAPGGTAVIAPDGVKLTSNGKMDLDAKGPLNIKSIGPVSIEGVGPMKLKTAGIVQIDGGTGASDFVLTNPTTLSPFTGSPLVPFSTTVQVSK